jgi:hypothetical protein
MNVNRVGKSIHCSDPQNVSLQESMRENSGLRNLLLPKIFYSHATIQHQRAVDCINFDGSIAHCEIPRSTEVT